MQIKENDGLGFSFSVGDLIFPAAEKHHREPFVCDEITRRLVGAVLTLFKLNIEKQLSGVNR